MKGKGRFVLTTLILILSFSVSLAFNDQMDVEATSGYPVHNLDTGLNYTSIQTAINANETLNGHTIFVEEGNYSEIVDVNKSISLIGENKHNTTIYGNSAGPIIWAKADNVTITGFTIQNRNPWNGQAIWLWSNCNIIHGNIIRNSAWGLSAYSSYNIISKNSIRNNLWGLDVSGSNNTVQSNNISNNTVTGIGLAGSYWNSICDNTITENGWGFRITISANNTICRNKIADNGGESGGGAIYLISSPSDNRFYQNNFKNNKDQIHFFNLASNIWDNGCEGNYWSDYEGVDLDHDGIGDDPYEMVGNNTDHRPLMGEFHSYRTSLGKHVNVISNSTIEDFTHFESNSTIKMHVSNMTGNQTHGFVRITVPHSLMTEPYNITVDGVNPTYWNYTLHDNGTHRWIYFEYEHSTLEIVIIPEFPSLIILPLLMIATLLAVLTYRRKLAKPILRISV